jgi:uncharacterized protein
MSDKTSNTQQTASTTRAKKRWRRHAFRILRIAVIVYLGVCFVIYFLQDWMIFPGHSSQGKSLAKIIGERDTEILQLKTADGDRVVAIYGAALLPSGDPDPGSAHRPTIIYFYGNASAVAWSMGEFDHFRRLGANVLIADFVGYGMSGGTPSEKALYATADCGYGYLLHRPDIDPHKIVTIGWSLGAAVAIDLASRKPVAGLATFNAFTSLTQEARHVMPWLPTTEICKYQFDSIRKIATVKCPIFICNGMRDTLISPKMSDQLAAAAGGPVTRLRIDAADHNTIFIAATDQPFPALGKFLDDIDRNNR